MNKTEIYKKSLSLLRQLVAETSKEELEKMVKSVKDLKIKGPTFEEYLNTVQTVFENLDWNNNSKVIITKPVAYAEKYRFNVPENYYAPPPRSKYNPVNKKHSSNIAECFFLV